MSGALATRLLTRTEAHKRIASILYPKVPLDTARRRVAERCRRAIKKSEIAAGKFADEAFCRWAMIEWPNLGWQDWMASEANINIVDASLTLPIPKLRVSVTSTPLDRNELEVVYIRAETERHRLSEENTELKNRIADLESRNTELEWRLKNRLKKQSDSGKKGGRGNDI